MIPYAQVDDPTADLLALVAQGHPAVGADAPALFLAACEADAAEHGGLVSVNRVRSRLDGAIGGKRLAALWCHLTGPGRPMVRTGEYDADDGVTTRNGCHVYPIRRWVGLS